MVALVRKGGDTTTRTEIQTAGSGKALGFWLWPLGAGRCKAAPYAIEGPHPSPAASSATVEEPRARKVAVRKVRKVVQTSGAHVLPGRPVRDQPKISADRTVWR